MSEPPLMLLLDRAVNRCLALDPEFVEELGAFSGRCVAIDVRGTGQRLGLEIDTSGVRLSATVPEDADLTVSGGPLDLVRAALELREQGTLPESVAITGDVELAQRLQTLVSRLDPDWEEPVAAILGDAAAHQLGRGVRSALSWLSQAGNTLLSDVAEYLGEESRAVAGGEEIDEFAQAVDDLRDDLARLERRVQGLGGPAGGGAP